MPSQVAKRHRRVYLTWKMARFRLPLHQAEATLMSGSGPSVFGIFGTKSKAEEAAGKLREGGIFAVCARTIRY